MGMVPPGVLDACSARGVPKVVPVVPTATPGVPLPRVLPRAPPIEPVCWACAAATPPSIKTIANASRYLIALLPDAGRNDATPAAVAVLADVARLDAFHAGIRHLLPGGGQRAVEIDGPGVILDHIDIEAELARIERRPGHAE